MMELVVIALVCSQLATPIRADCVVDSSIRHQKLAETATSDMMCEMNGMFYAAQRMHVDAQSEYVKVMCVRPSVEIGNMPG